LKLYVGEKLIADDLKIAKDFYLRFKGLMFRGNMNDNEALIIPRCNWVHTMFMGFPIDVVYLDSDYVIIDMESGVKPWRMCMPRLKAAHTLELVSGTAKNKLLRTGEVVRCIA